MAPHRTGRCRTPPKKPVRGVVICLSCILLLWLGRKTSPPLVGPRFIINIYTFPNPWSGVVLFVTYSENPRSGAQDTGHNILTVHFLQLVHEQKFGLKPPGSEDQYRWSGSKVRTQIPVPNTNTNPNKGGEYVSFYLEYEYESELGRVSSTWLCIYVYLYRHVSHLVVLLDGNPDTRVTVLGCPVTLVSEHFFYFFIFWREFIFCEKWKKTLFSLCFFSLSLSLSLFLYTHSLGSF